MSEKQYAIPAIELPQAEYNEGETDQLDDVLGYYEEDGNLVGMFDRSVNDHLCQKIMERIQDDINSMSDYKRMYENAIKLAKMEDDSGDKTFPFVGASRVMSSMLLEASIEFNARVAPTILGNPNICKVKVNSADPTEKKEKQIRGDRVSTAINTIITQMIPNWRDDKDRAFTLLPIVGTYFTKTWIDHYHKFYSKLIFADEMIFDHKADTFEVSEFKTHPFWMSRNEVISAIRKEELLGIDETDLMDEEESFEFYESHCVLDLDEDGYAEPYIAVIMKDLDRLVGLYPRYRQEDIVTTEKGEITYIHAEEYFSQTIFVPDPFGSCMGLGWGIILSDTYQTINTNLRQTIDAGTLQNTSANSGFIRQGTIQGPRGGNRQRKGEMDLVLGKMTTLPSSGNTPLKDDIMMFPFAGPSQQLIALMEMMKEEVRRFTTISSGIEANAGEAAELYLARLQENMRLPNSLMMRVYSGLTKEFDRVFNLISRYYSNDQYADLIDMEGVVVSEDFDLDRSELVTTADPSQGSEQERISKASYALEQAKQNPQMVNLREAYKRVFEEMGIPDVEALIMPEQEGPTPLEQQQQQYLQMEGQIRMTELQLKQKEVEIKAMSVQRELAKEARETMQADSEIRLKDAQAEKTLSETMLNVQQFEAENIGQIMEEVFSLQQYLQSLNNKEVDNDARLSVDRSPQAPSIQRSADSGMAGPSPNLGIPSNPQT